MFASCKPNQVFGEKALENDNKRGASVKALKECKMLRLKKLHYRSIVLVTHPSPHSISLGSGFNAKICSFGIFEVRVPIEALVAHQATRLQQVPDRENLQPRQHNLQIG